MKYNDAYEWIKTNESRKRILLLMKLPLTAKQMSPKLQIDPARSSRLLSDFVDKGFAVCLNLNAQNSRLFNLTPLGKDCQRKLCLELNLPLKELAVPAVDWNLYGWVCFSHRAAIVKTLTEPMKPSEIKRQLRRRNSRVNISANNIRDIIKLFAEKGIVEKVYLKRKVHPLYELTQTGKQLQALLLMEKACY